MAEAVEPPQEAIMLPEILPETYYPCLTAQKCATLATLTDLSAVQFSLDGIEEEAAGERGPQSQNDIAFKYLLDLLEGTTKRGEGNSCLILGPRSSGKSNVCE